MIKNIFESSKNIEREIGHYLFGTWIYLLLLVAILSGIKLISNKTIKFIFKWIVQLLFVISVLNITLVMLLDQTYIKYPSDAYAMLPSGDGGVSYMVPFNGNNLHFRCYENNNNNCNNTDQCKTILFESGLPFYSSVWGNVISKMVTMMGNRKDYSEELAQIGRFCVYDRYGYGWSDSRTESIGALQMSNDLSEYLNVLGIGGDQIIFVGWSYGGAIGQIFTSQKKTAGLVLVDSMDIIDGTNDALIQGIIDGKNSFLLLNLFRLTGIPRIIDSYPLESGYLSAQIPLDPHLKYYSNHVFLNSDFLQAAWHELNVLLDSLRDLEIQINTTMVANNGYPFGSTPLVVLTAGENGDHDWIQRQNTLASYSSNSFHIINNNTNHFVPFQSPDSIINAIIKCISMINQQPNQ
ncbi:hypothetical protein PPL_09730 [Heterostelium album PN500]|uniref:AB hydrolase-1 domain-containing protein n=1 Tax=Heterostelium pallidum (strain ATCC 26659 / Pp 5 / PN500) TaxID=670386 RepID=D3BNM7_HETP5|nr:hypothetical protein PPL_09730 [Heterostelium album PN500]EFA76978.1 hypothetical protein PPL_09730 [Heterostelium album PN500]|eukprot:XP_020429109.1 hypothetical protein PPL_09730 [Heterostelium album PN500]